MLLRYLRLTPDFETPTDGSGGGSGTTGNVAGAGSASSSASGSSSGSTGRVTSGTASEALIKAAMASSSDATATGTGAAGDTTGQSGSGATATTVAAATAQAGQAESSAAGSPAGSGNKELEARFQTVSRNARGAVLQAFGFDPNTDTRSPEFQRQTANIQRAAKLAEMLSTPEGAQAFYENLGSKLGVATRQGNGGAQPAELKLPDADLVSQDGKVRAYSAEAFTKALGTHGEMVKQALLAELKPIIDTVNGIKTKEETAAQQERGRALLGQALGHARTLPHFKESEAAIVQALQQMDPRLRTELGPVAATYMAYGQVLAKNVFPGMKSSIEKDIRASFARDAAASNGHIAPQGGGDGKKVDIANVDQLAAHMARLAAAAT